MKQSEINEIKQRAFDTCKNYPVINVLDKYYTGPRGQKGSNIFIECPHGCDRGVSARKLSKCSVSKAKNIFTCFGCGEKGGPTKLQELLTGQTYGQAMLEQARELGSITWEEYDAVTDPATREKFSKDDKAYKKLEEVKTEEVFLASPKVRHIVYSALLSLDEFQLSEEMIQYLHETRHISGTVEELSKSFFYYHADFSVEELVKLIRGKYPKFNFDDLYGVPGFYFSYADDSKTHGRWTFVPCSKESIGIIVRDADGMITALQSRNIVRENSSYYWISSNGKAAEAGYGYGSSPGAPTHVEYPKQVLNGCVSFIEGIFKVKQLVKVSHGLCLAFQGVNNYASTLDEVQTALHSDILKQRIVDREDGKKHKLNFALFYDADMLMKFQVWQAAQGFYHELHRRFPDKKIYFYIWDVNEGKGFDDLYENHPTDWKKFLVKIPGAKFEEIMIASLDEAVKHFGFSSPSDSLKDKKLRDAFSHYLYESAWSRL